MKNRYFFGMLVLLFSLSSSVYAQFGTRQDVIWARTINSGSITLDGNLNEPAWAQAEILQINYGQPGKLPTSGWREEFQPDAITDPTRAPVRFLAKDNVLYLGFYIPDSSIGGTGDWARWDGILMSVKDKLSPQRPALAVEYFYTWWLAGLPNTTPVIGSKPRFVGRFGNFNDTTRTPQQVEAWDAVTIIDGTSNDAQRDRSWTVEMKVDLTVLGYNTTAADGDVVNLNFSIWDCDYLFEGNPTNISTTRTHFQSPWGNANANNVGRIHIRPDVTLSTTTLPAVNPDVIVPNGANFPDPAIDGRLQEEVWSGAYSFDIAFGDSLLRKTYPGAGALASGEFQPELNGNPRPPVLDPGFSKVKMFFKGKYLYLGADVNDQLIQGTEVYDRMDGLRFMIGSRSELNSENAMTFKSLLTHYNFSGQPAAYEYLQTLVDSGGASYAVALKGNSTVNNNTDVDEGYSVEMKIDLTKLGYDAGLSDKLLFMGVMLADGDSFDDTLANYGTRTWWFREHDGGPACAWMVMDPNTVIVDVQDEVTVLPNSIEIQGNYPNPFNPATTLRYSLPENGIVTLSVFNALGEEVFTNTLPQQAGFNEFTIAADNWSSGVYFYQLSLTGLSTGARFISTTGKMMYLK